VFIELRDRRKPLFRWATPLLLALCVTLSLAVLRLDAAQQLRAMYLWGVVPAQLTAWSHPDWHPGWAVLRLFSAMFLHADAAHLLGNLVFLAVFGLAVERLFRGRLCLALFLFCGVLSNLCTALLLKDTTAPIVGCSGAVSGLIGAYLYLFPRARLGLVLPLGLYFQLVRVPAQHLIGLWFLLQVLYTIAAPGLSTVAWWAHVIGFASGFLIAVLLRPVLYRRASQNALF
jgi:membrane associated rhomboid family serine protease